MEKSAFTVGWICALSVEMSVAIGMLDERYDSLPLSQDPRDQNTYVLGRIGGHHVAIACLPKTTIGLVSAALVAARMRWTFPSLRIGLMVGIGGGAPSEEHDIRLGDVVVSSPTGQSGGVIQYDLGKTLLHGKFERTGSLNKPPAAIMTAVSAIEALDPAGESKFLSHLSEMTTRNPELSQHAASPGADKDQLFNVDYDHCTKDPTCENCSTDQLVVRPRKKEGRPWGGRPVVHYGLIASGNQVIKTGVVREQLRKELNILCFEMEAAGLMDEFPCVVIRGICDYADSHKHKEWQPYAAATAAAYAKELLLIIAPIDVAKAEEIGTILTNVKAQVDEMSTKMNAFVIATQSHRSAQLLDRLSSVNFWDKQKDVYTHAHEGTGTWVLDEPAFKSWLTGHDGILWCQGIAGAGKTVLTSIIINHLIELFEHENVGIAWIYLNYREKDLQSLENIFASLLRQLLQQSGGDTEALITSIGVGWKQGKPNLTAYKNMLQKALQQYNKTFIVIDALDESQSQALGRELVCELRSLRPIISLLITSRPLRNMQNFFGDASQIKIMARLEDVKKYLDSFLKANKNLRKLVDADPKLESVITKFVTKSDDGMFLKAKLQLHILAQKETAQDITTYLRTLPDSYTEIYESYLKQVERQDKVARELAFRVLTWLSHAVDPFTVGALQTALSIQQEYPESQEEVSTDAESLVSICCGFVEVDQETQVIRLLHETAEEYLKSVRSANFPDGHSIISLRCLEHLSLDKFSGLCGLQTLVEERSLKDSFYAYAAKNWSKHVLLGDLESQLQEQIVAFLESHQRLSTDETMARHRHSAWGTDKSSPWTDWNRNSTQRRDLPLHAAATYGLRKTVRFLLKERGYVIERLNNFGETALQRAAQVGQTTTMDELILNGADLNAKVQHWYLKQATPMILASACLQIDAVRVLLNHGVDINAFDPENRFTPLHFAASMDTNLTRFLLDWGADPNVLAIRAPHFPELPPMSSLHFCVYFAHAYDGACNRLKLLLKSGAHVNQWNGRGNTALHIAILGGHLDLAEILLDGEADIYATNLQDKSPIQLAKELGYFSWFQKWIPSAVLDGILETTPLLSQAIWENNISLVHHLLEQDVDLIERDHSGKSPWDYCVLNTNVEIAEILANHMDSKGLPARVGSDAFGSALFRMTTFDYSDTNAWEKALAICNRLLKYREAENPTRDFAKVRSTVNQYNKTCVIMAAEIGRVGEVEFFLKCGTDVNAVDIYRSTAAHYAVHANKNRETLALLIKYGADLSIKEQNGRTVLNSADGSVEPGLRKFLEEELAKRDSQVGIRRSESQATSQPGDWITIAHDRAQTAS